MPKRLTALGRISERSNLACNARCNAKDYGNEKMVNYREGEMAAYNDSYRLMKAEIERLRLQFQNGCLTMNDFNTENEEY